MLGAHARPSVTLRATSPNWSPYPLSALPTSPCWRPPLLSPVATFPHAVGNHPALQGVTLTGSALIRYASLNS